MLGVYFHKASGLWMARVRVNGKDIVKYHKTKEAAGRAALDMRRTFYPGFVGEIDHIR
jgi:hypothetical protein